MCRSDEDESPSPSSDPTLAQSSHHATQNVMVVKLIGERRLYMNGFVYVKNHTDSHNKVHWECRRYRKKKCRGRAITSNSTLSENVILYRGLEESPHNHKPSTLEVQEADEAAKIEQSGKRKLQIGNLSHLDHESCDSKNRTPADVELQVSKPTKRAVKMDVDESIAKSKSKRAAPSTTRQSILNSGLDNAVDHLSPRLVGNKLYIDGFSYYKNASYISDGHLSKIRWVCQRYETQKCLATAITSDPFKDPVLTVYNGPDETEHCHSRCRADVEEAEKEANCASRKNPTATNVIIQDVGKADPSDAQSPTVFTLENLESGISEELGNSAGIQLATSSEVSETVGGLNNENLKNEMQVKLIGKRLCINGYIYTKNSNGPGVNWVCRRYRKTGCSAKVSTSNPFIGEELAIYKVDDLSHHNHPSCELEIEEAELLAKLELNRSKLENSQVAEVQNGSNTSCAQNLSLRNQMRREEVKPAIVTSSDPKPSPQQKTEKRLSAVPPRMNRSPRSLRFIGGRLCIDGYIYVKSSVGPKKIKWECRRYRNSRCPGRASTSNTSSSKELVVYKGPESSKHVHPPSPTEVAEAEDWARARKKIRKSKLKIGSGKVKSEVTHSQASQQNTSGQLQGSKSIRASNNEKNPLKNRPRTKKNGLLQDHQVYRKFLVKFLKKPVFDRQSVIEALQIIYSSKQGCLMAYATILENRKKVEQDLEALKNNPKATIAALNSDSFTTLPDKSPEMDIDFEQVSEHDPTAPSSISSTDAAFNERVSKIACDIKAEKVVTDTCAQKMGASQPTQNFKSQELPPLCQEKIVDPIPPVPAALALKDLSSSEQFVSNVSRNQSEIRPEIICIDLTDDSDEPPRVKQELSDIGAETSSQSNKTKKVVVISNSVMAPFVQGIESDLTRSVEVIPHSNYLREMSSFGPSQPSYHSNQFAMHPNCANAYYNPAIYNSLDYRRESPNFNSSYTVNNLQVPVMINVPSMRSNASANPDIFYSQLQVLHQANLRK